MARRRSSSQLGCALGSHKRCISRGWTFLKESGCTVERQVPMGGKGQLAGDCEARSEVERPELRQGMERKRLL